MALVLDGSGDITGLTAGALPSNVVGSGAVLQVVQSVKTDTFTTTSTSFTSITGLTASITPISSSSKILIFVNVTGSQQVGANDAYIGIFRDDNQIALGDSAGSRIRHTAQLMTSNAGWSTNANMSFLDLPSTTSPTTYSIRVRTNGTGTLYVNRGNNDQDSAIGASRSISSIIVMEVA
jgi:hypothetical protein